jgi:hypothetical protein
LFDMFGELIDDMYGNRTAFAGGDLTTVHTPVRSDDETEGAA